VRIDHDRGLVVKRFRSSERGEPAREWAALTLLDEFAPGLAPAPVRGDLDGDPPAIVMSWLPGAQLGTIAPLSGAQTNALALALERLWRSVPTARTSARLGPALNPVALTSQVRAMLAAGPGLARTRSSAVPGMPGSPGWARTQLTPGPAPMA